MAALEDDRYDVIVFVNLHGAYDLSKEQECELVSIPEDYRVTFLEAVSCGVSNITNRAWYDYTREFINAFITIFGPTRELAVQSQIVLRNIKQLELKNPKSGMNTLLKEMLHDARTVKAKKFKDTPGWEIKTINKDYANREYEQDPTWPMHMIVVYTEHETLPLNTNLSSKVLKPFSRKTLLDYLYEQGARRPLIIDNSCGDVCADSPTAERRAVREVSKNAMGGRRKTKRQKGTYRRNQSRKK
jgi:hypothetical protein